MTIDRVVVGTLDTNCYILKIDDKCLVIDPGDDFDKIKMAIGDSKPVGIIVTHSHFDHTGALNDVKRYYKIKEFNYYNLKEGMNKIASFNFEVIYTPGHKKDLISIFFKEECALFCGDFIFNGSIGRYDFSDSSFIDMKKSIKKILSYPQDMIIFPGHGPKTDLKSELEMLIYYLNL